MSNTLNHHVRILCSMLVALTLVFSVGCTWVKKTPDAAKVRIVPADRVSDCIGLGNVTSTTTQNVAIINRKAAKVQTELETLAQNEAAESGADTIVAMSKVVDGRQTFAMYRCL